MTHPIPGNDDAVKSIRIIVDTIIEAAQAGLAHREAKKIQKSGPIVREQVFEQQEDVEVTLPAGYGDEEVKPAADAAE